MKFYETEFPSIYRGIVELNEDPRNLGRCKIRIPAIHGGLNYSVDVLPWARPISSSTINSTRGVVNIPDVGDVVWVMFEGANRDYPVYLGGTYSSVDIPIELNKVIIYIDENNKIVYDRELKSYTINSGENSIEINQEIIKILGNSFIKGDMDIEGNVTIKGNLDIQGNVGIHGTLSVTGSILLNGKHVAVVD